jgi:hypothetical protein
MGIAATTKTVATPCDAYLAKAKLWKKCRAVCGSEEEVKDHDALVHHPDNFLIPFSPSMQQDQYDFLRSEAELPGISAEFSHLLSGALLRKEPEIVLPDDVPAGAREWIVNEFGRDGVPIASYMLSSVSEEVVSSRGWTFVDMDTDSGVPFATLYPAESIINWEYDATELTRVIVCVYESIPGQSEFHPVYVPVIRVHELFNDAYRVRTFRQTYDENGNVKQEDWIEQPQPDKPPMYQGELMDFIPAWPNNGELDPVDPFLTTIVNKEIALYNKVTRRNHLLLGAGTYTPYVSGVQDPEAFNKIVSAGLGSWLHLPDKDSKLDVLKPPTEALVDYDRSIASGIQELAQLGVRMLSPETAQSGVALQLRNASQTARLGTLNTRISVIMSQVIATMLNWRYNTEYTADQIKFKLQDDFAQTIVGEGWLRLATEWYENGHIPRTVWVQLLKANDVLEDDYDDEEGQKEIVKDEDSFKSYTDKIASAVNTQLSGAQPQAPVKKVLKS